MRLLPIRHDHGRGSAVGRDAEPERCRYRWGHHQYLPLRHLRARAPGDPARRGGQVMARRRLTRRRLLVAYGAWRAGSAKSNVAGTSDAAGANLHEWVHVARDGTVTVRCGRSEMGQGAFTGIGTLVAEELDCAWKQVRVETGPVAPSFANVAVGEDLLESNGGFAKAQHGWVTTKIAQTVAQQITGGSSSIVDSFQRAREAGAVARAMLVAAA